MTAGDLDVWFYDRPLADVLPWAVAYAAYWDGSEPLGLTQHPSGTSVPPLDPPEAPTDFFEPATPEEVAANPHVQESLRGVDDMLSALPDAVRAFMPTMADLSRNPMMADIVGLINADLGGALPRITIRVIEPSPGAAVTLIETSTGLHDLSFRDFIGRLADARLHRVARCHDPETGHLTLATISVRSFDRTLREVTLWREDDDDPVAQPALFQEQGTPMPWEDPAAIVGPLDDRLSLDHLHGVLSYFGIDPGSLEDRRFARAIDLGPGGDTSIVTRFADQIAEMDSLIARTFPKT